MVEMPIMKPPAVDIDFSGTMPCSRVQDAGAPMYMKPCAMQIRIADVQLLVTVALR